MYVGGGTPQNGWSGNYAGSKAVGDFRVDVTLLYQEVCGELRRIRLVQSFLHTRNQRRAEGVVTLRNESRDGDISAAVESSGHYDPVLPHQVLRFSFSVPFSHNPRTNEIERLLGEYTGVRRIC